MAVLTGIIKVLACIVIVSMGCIMWCAVINASNALDRIADTLELALGDVEDDERGDED